MYEGPEFRHLITFVAIAEECSFNRAAERLHIAQPALTKHIKSLEEGLGEALFKRVPAGAELTETGRKFLPVARQMLHMREHAVNTASRSSTRVEWPLRFGYSPFMNHNLLVKTLNVYREIVPDGRVISTSDSTAELVNMLHDGRLDAAIVPLPVTVPELSQSVLAEDEVMICLRKDDPMASLAAIPKESVEERLSIMFSRHSHPELFDHIFKRFARSAIHICPTESYSAPSEMQFLVKHHGYFGLECKGIPLDPELTMRPIKGLRFCLETALVYRNEWHMRMLSILAYRMALVHGDDEIAQVPKKTSVSSSAPSGALLSRLG
jgi:DNA-binding transcriptional LysR family regulator